MPRTQTESGTQIYSVSGLSLYFFGTLLHTKLETLSKRMPRHPLTTMEREQQVKNRFSIEEMRSGVHNLPVRNFPS
jgi:hypothetical protein